MLKWVSDSVVKHAGHACKSHAAVSISNISAMYAKSPTLNDLCCKLDRTKCTYGDLKDMHPLIDIKSHGMAKPVHSLLQLCRTVHDLYENKVAVKCQDGGGEMLWFEHAVSPCSQHSAECNSAVQATQHA